MDRYAVSGSEPSLSEVLDDPIVRLVMARDKVGRDDLVRLVETHRGYRAADLAKAGGSLGGRGADIVGRGDGAGDPDQPRLEHSHV